MSTSRTSFTRSPVRVAPHLDSIYHNHLTFVNTAAIVCYQNPEALIDFRLYAAAAGFTKVRKL